MIRTVDNAFYYRMAVVSSFVLYLSAPVGCSEPKPVRPPSVTPERDAGTRVGGSGGGAGMNGGGSGGAGGDTTGNGDGGGSDDSAAPTPPSGDLDGGSTPDVPGTIPPDTAPPAPPPCVMNMPCVIAEATGGSGVCRNGVCSACNGMMDDATCTGIYGPNTICAQRRCVTQNCGNSANCPRGQLCEPTARVCQACTTDPQCKADTVYGANFICLNGRCIDGDCRDSTMCMPGKVCGVPVANNCGNCTASQQCVNDPRYRDHVCVQGSCVPGDCGNSNQCNAAKEGLICGVMMPNRCGACTTNAQCAGDAKYAGSQRVTCFVGDGADKGKCVSNACTAVNQRCPQNPATFCCASGNQMACVAGDCCVNANCLGGQLCVANRCTAAGVGCDMPVGNALVVDPVGGVDTSSGSGRAGGAGRADCAFRTLTAALASAARGVGNNGNITIVGQQGRTIELRTADGSAANPAETLPITVPANVNVRITTAGGPILLRVSQAGTPAIRVATPRFELVPAANARLVIDGMGVAGGSGIEIAAGTAMATLQNVTVQNTRDHGIRIAAGVVAVGPGVEVRGAGIAAARRSGLHITGGTAQIRGGTAPLSVVFEGNTGAGISVVQNGGLDALGAPVNGQIGTVVVRNNAAAGDQPGGVYIEQLPSAANVTIGGLVIIGHANSAGINLRGGSKLKLRGSVVLDNGTGVLLSAVGTNQEFSGVDLGRAGDPGRNTLQVAGAATRNSAGGLCFANLIAATPVVIAVPAQGNLFAGVDCSVAPPAGMVKTLRTAAACQGNVDLAIPADQPMLTVDSAVCVQTQVLAGPQVPF